MSEPRRGRPAHRFTIRRIRLVNFHNLVDETVEVREGGHLFLLGDNGSGKTTLLDAVHLALTGWFKVELNAAARVAGGKIAGRTLQGIVLRYDAERGVVNERGAIAYAVLELVDDTQGAVLCAGVGIEATTMDADVNRWALLHRGPLEEIPLLEPGPDGGQLPATRELLRDRLGKLAVFARMPEYRRELATRLFGGQTLYDEVCEFWKMAKAYREIVSQARDFAGLFLRLLPEPDAQVFGDILSSLRALDELEVLLEQLGRQREHVAGLADLVNTIRQHREEIARYRWLIGFRRRSAALQRQAELMAALRESTRAVERHGAEVTAAKGALDVAREALRAADARDPEGLVGSLRQAEAQLARDEGDVALASATVEGASGRVAASDRELARALAERDELHRARIEALLEASDATRCLDAPLEALYEAIAGERAVLGLLGAEEAPPALPEIGEAPWRDVEALRNRSAELRSRAENARARAEHELDARRRDLLELEAAREEQPRVAGLGAARAALDAAGIRAEPLFELLEPVPLADAAELAALEALLGDEALASLVVHADDLTVARAHALPHAGVRIVVRTAPDAPLPAWAGALFGSRTPGTALAALGTLLSQAPSLGVLMPPDALGNLEHRGAATRALAPRPRLIGAEARRRAHEASLRAAREALARAEKALASAEAELGAAERASEGARRVESALRALRAQDLVEAHAALRAEARRRVHMVEALAEARARSAELDRRRLANSALVETLRGRLEAAGLEALEQHLAELRRRENAAVADYESAVGRRAAAEKEQDHRRAELALLERELEERSAELSRLSTALRRALVVELAGGDDALERYVRVERRGDQFRSIENLEERLRESERAEAAACQEIGGDGSRGTRNLEWAGRFGFSWDGDTATVVDRRGDPLPGVLARVESELAGQHEVVNERTRELMDKLVMGDLARELQEQVERLHRTVREMNQLLADLRFGTTRYQFRITPRPEFADLVGLVRKLSLFDNASRGQFRELVGARFDELRRFDQNSEYPDVFDYRRWFDYRLCMRSVRDDDTELTRELRALGSGGEQGVPNYLLVLALARLMFENAGARVRPLLFDEAFYGIDAGRREQLLRFATELGLQLVVASPDQDGVVPSARRTTTLFLVKDEHGDVHLAPYHYWNDGTTAQAALFPERPLEPDPERAACVVGIGAVERDPG